jgi:hypothetical protein
LLADGVIHMFGNWPFPVVRDGDRRPGGLIPANGLSVKDLVMYGGVSPSGSALLGEVIDKRSIPQGSAIGTSGSRVS